MVHSISTGGGGAAGRCDGHPLVWEDSHAEHAHLNWSPLAVDSTLPWLELSQNRAKIYRDLIMLVMRARHRNCCLSFSRSLQMCTYHSMPARLMEFFLNSNQGRCRLNSLVILNRICQDMIRGSENLWSNTEARHQPGFTGGSISTVDSHQSTSQQLLRATIYREDKSPFME